MLNTILGTILISLNGSEYKYSPVKLKNECQIYRVDDRYEITVYIDTNINPNIIEYKLINKYDIVGGKHSGQDLASIRFEYNNISLHIGVHGDIPHVKYIYLDDGIKVIIPKEANIKKIKSSVAWLTMADPDREYTYTWFAADPTYRV